MLRCHNCGRETLRTEDWACQWCGYPLVSNSVGKIEKTYSQIKKERLYGIEEETAEDISQQEEIETEIAIEEDAEIVQESETEAIAEETEEAVAAVAEEPKEDIKEEIEIEEAVTEESATEEEAEVGIVVEINKEEEPEPELEPEPEVKPEPEQVVEQAECAEPEPEPVPEPEPEPKEEESEEEEEPELEPAEIEITAIELFKAYEEDDTAVDERFINKIIRLTGVVSIIDIKNISDMHYIRLTGSEGDLMQSVQCMFGKKHTSSLSQLERGQTVTVQGRYNGSIIAMRLADCVLVE